MAAGKWKVYDLAKKALADGTLDLDSNTLKVALFSSHELETVERISAHVVILHRGKVVADDSIERLRSLMAASTLEDIFAQLASERDTAAVSRQIADLIDA